MLTTPLDFPFTKKDIQGSSSNPSTSSCVSAMEPVTGAAIYFGSYHFKKVLNDKISSLRWAIEEIGLHLI